MVNLLPPETQRALTTTYYTRLLTCALLVLGGAVAASVVLLAPTYLSILATAADAERYVTTFRDLADQRAASGGAEKLVALSESIKLLDSAYHAPQFGGALVAVTDALPAGVSLDTIHSTFNDDGTLTITLGGVASTRSALIRYSDELKATRGLSGVAVPVSALVAEVNNSFSMTVQYRTPPTQPQTPSMQPQTP